jgi:hypothetical protein
MRAWRDASAVGVRSLELTNVKKRYSAFERAGFAR